MDKQKKTIAIVTGVVLALLISVGGAVFYFMNKEKPEDALNAYVQALNEKDYETAYGLLSETAKKTYDQDTFITRNANIYSGIGASNIKLEVKDTNDQTISYHMTMNTYAGELAFDHSMTLVDEDGYKLDWNSSFIHPELTDTDRIYVSVDIANRGAILDRNGIALAEDGTAMQVGVVPGAFNGKEDDILKTLAEKLNVEVSFIKEKMSASWVSEGLFVPIKTISNNDPLKSELQALDGVQINSVSMRVYPYKEKAAHLTGYVHTITAEELEAHKDQGYDETSIIGATGLEAIYEETLRGEDGCTITILDESENVKTTVLSRKATHGTDVKTTIDANIQSSAYDSLLANKDSGVVTAMNPKTGEVLALVSAPAYDPNDFALGMSDKTWKSLNENTQTPLNNRFVGAYTPGSTFKAITAAIGLNTGTFSAEDDFGNNSSTKWQADDSWGDFYVTTTQSYSGPSMLKSALVYSDNIYFAKATIKIGSEKFAESLMQFGFTKQMEFPFTMSISTFGDENKIAEGTQLADTGYGQGKLQINPLHLTALYSSFVNDGNAMKPYLDQNDEKKNTVWLKNLMSKQVADTIYTDLIAAMEHYGGTTTGRTIGGKTGTAEVGDNHLSWICTVTNDGTQPIAITLMIENTKGKSEQGHYAVPIMQTLLNNILK